MQAAAAPAPIIMLSRLLWQSRSAARPRQPFPAYYPRGISSCSHNRRHLLQREEGETSGIGGGSGGKRRRVEMGADGVRPEQTYSKHIAYSGGRFVGKGIKLLKNSAEDSGLTRGARTLKQNGFKSIGVDESTGDQVLKAGAGVLAIGAVAARMKRTVVGGAAAGVLYLVGRAHSPQRADQILLLGKAGVQAGAEFGGERDSVWQSPVD